MPYLQIDQLVASMLRAAKGALSKQWPEAKYHVAREFTKIGMTIALIESQRALNQIDEEKARMHLKTQVNSSKSVLLTVEGLGNLPVEAAFNAAMDVVRTTVNESLGFVLI